jgi:hypothetical protein
MEVGIITKIGKNYGAVLQAYALRRTIELMGYNAHVINYIHKKSVKTYHVFKYKWGFRGTIGNIKALQYMFAIKKSSRKFNEFKNRELSLTRPYTTLSQLQDNPPKHDLYISGSDQVWNPTISFDPAYYLQFGSEDVIRASYAASIGIKQIPKELRAEFIRRISQFDYISVRERTAKRTLAEFGFEAKVALDPTLLLKKNYWNGISIKPKVEKPFILCYMVSTPTFAYDLIKRVKEVTGMPIYNIATSTFNRPLGDYQIWDAGPEEFLGYFQEASFVITSSFHGTILSLINEKPFISMLFKATGSRVNDMLSNLGISNRAIENSDEFDKNFLSMDYTEISQKIEHLRSESLEILGDILKIKKVK